MDDIANPDHTPGECSTDVHGPTSRLTDGINIQDLIANKEASFEVKQSLDSHFYENEGSNELFNKELVENEFLDDGVALGIVDDSDSESSETCSSSPFEQLEKKMHDISGGNRLVLKMIKKQGYGEIVPEHATVSVHYSISLEYQDFAADSSYLRGQPFNFKLGGDEALIGFQMSVGTMRKKEISYFLLQPSVAYRELGIPPRIPGNSVVLLKIELLDIINDGEAKSYSKLTLEERGMLSFDEIVKSADSEHSTGNYHFKHKMFRKAAKCYKRATNMLLDFHLKDAEEECRQQKLLLTYYLNLSLCWLKLNKAPPAITNCNCALDIDPNNVKALFRKGKGYRMLQEFSTARKLYQRALRLEPNNKDIIDEIKSLGKSIKEVDLIEKAMCQKMFISSNRAAEKKSCEIKKEKDSKAAVNVSEEFQDYIAEKLTDIKYDDNIKELKLPSNLNTEELGFTTVVAKEVGLKMVTRTENGKMISKIVKE